MPFEQPTRSDQTLRRRGRGVAQESAHGREQVAAVEEATEDLIVDRVQPLAADFERVASRHDRQVVLDLRPPEQLVDARVQEVGLPKRNAGSPMPVSGGTLESTALRGRNSRA